MNEQPLVSILIDNYNYSLYLREAINSAIAQTYLNTEIIVVDDGSTDNSQDIIAMYGDKVKPIFKENGGQASAFNAGFAVSKGEIICILDSDDIWLPKKVEQVVESTYDYPNASVIYHKVQNINQSGTPIDEAWPPYKVIRGDISSQVAKTGGWWPFPPSTGLSFTRQFLSKVMDIPETEYRICADTYLADLAPFFGDVVGIDKALSLFRIHDANNWSNPVDTEKRSLYYHELRVKVLNRVLKESGINVEVYLKDNWPYQQLKYRSKKGESIVELITLIFHNPWEKRFLSRLKSTLKLLFYHLNTG